MYTYVYSYGISLTEPALDAAPRHPQTPVSKGPPAFGGVVWRGSAPP
jgi:hypothetical protein